MEQQIHIVTAQDGSVFQDNASVLRPGRLEGLKVPVLLMQGSASPKVIGMVMDVLEQRLHDVRRVTVKGASHMLPITHAGPVAAAINGFLSP